MNPDLEGSVYSIPSSIYPFPSVAEAPSAVLHWQAGDHGSGTGSPLLPQRDRLPRYRTLTENELAEGDDGIAIAGRKGPGAASLQHASKPSSLRTAQSMPTLASNRGKRKNADTSAGVVADSHEKDAGAALSRTMSSTDQRREIVGTDPAGRQSPSRQTSRTKAKTTSREPAHASGSGAVHQTHAEAEGLYGIHFETAAERRWRLRPPVEDRARVRAQKVVGSLVDSLVAGEHEAKHGWKLTKYALKRQGLGKPRESLPADVNKSISMVEELEPGVYDAWREEAASVILQDSSTSLQPAKVVPLPAVVLQRNPTLARATESQSMTLSRGQLPSLSIQKKVRDHIVQKLGPFPSEHEAAASLPANPDAHSLSQVLADPSFYLTDTYKPKTFGTTAKHRREMASSAPASLDSLSNSDVMGHGSVSASTASLATGTDVSNADELLSRLLDTSAAEHRMKQTSRRAKRDRLVESKLMASSALQRYPRSIISFWDKYAQKSLPADALTKGQAKRLAQTMKADGELDPSINFRHPKAADFHRAAARADWMKEPWLLLDVPPHSVSSIDSVHNVMGSVYSVGVTRQGVDELVDQYAKRADDSGILDVVGAQMAEGGVGSLATGLEGEVSDLKRKQQEEEDRRMGRIRKRQQVFGNKKVLGLEAAMVSDPLPPTDSMLALSDGSTLDLHAVGEVNPDRVEISAEMKARLDSLIAEQLGSGYWNDEVASILAKPLDSTAYVSRDLSIQAAGSTAAPKFVADQFEDGATLKDYPRTHLGLGSSLYDTGNQRTTALYSVHFDPNGGVPAGDGSHASAIPAPQHVNTRILSPRVTSMSTSSNSFSSPSGLGLNSFVPPLNLQASKPGLFQPSYGSLNTYDVSSASVIPVDYGLFPYSSTAHDAATKIARAFRALRARRRRAVILFQSAWRGRKIRHMFRLMYLRATAAAMRIQSLARGIAARRFVAYHKWLAMTAAAIRFQAAWRALKGRRKAQKQRDGRLHHLASKIQGLYKIAADRVRLFYVRHDVFRYRYERKFRSALLIQRMYRGLRGRKLARHRLFHAHTLILWWRQHMKPLRRAAITMQRIARGFLVRLRQYGRRLIHLQARVRGVLARLAWARHKIALRKQERRRWLTEQADVGMAVFHGVREILTWMDTNEAKAIVKQEKAIMKEEAKITKKLSKPKLTEAEQEVKALRDAFDLFDVDGSGDIDRSEFKNLMKELCVEVSNEDVTEAMKYMDVDKSGTISFAEFWDWYSGKSAAEAEAARAEEERLQREKKKPQRGKPGPSRGRTGRLHVPGRDAAVSSPQAAAKSGRELLAKSGGSMLGLVRVKLKGRKFVNDILGKTALARAKRRVVIARKLEHARLERAALRQKHPPNYACATCIRTFALREDLIAHHMRACNPDEAHLVALTMGLVEADDETEFVRGLVERNKAAIQAIYDAEAAKIEAERVAKEAAEKQKKEEEAKRIADAKAAAEAALKPNDEEDIDAFLDDDDV